MLMTPLPLIEYQKKEGHLYFHSLQQCISYYLVINKVCHIIATDSSIVYFTVFGQQLSIPLERGAYTDQ